MSPRVTLASGSYQRQRLLSLLGVVFSTEISGFDEYAVAQADFTDLGEYVSAIAAGKVLETASRLEGLEPADVVIGGDLLCFAEGGRSLGKPVSFSQAREYLDLLAGSWHHEVSAVCLWSEQQKLERAVSHIDLLLPPLNETEKQTYLEEANPLDKAGGFSLSAYAKALRRRGEDPAKILTLRGSVTGVLGFPVIEASELLSQYGISVPVNATKLEERLRRDILAGNPL